MPVGQSLRKTIALAVGLLFLGAACATTLKKGKEESSPKEEQSSSVDFKLSERLKTNPPRTVAVLPFKGKEGDLESAQVVRRSFYNHFSSKPFTDLELYKVDETLRREQIASPEVFEKVEPSALGRMLNVDAVIYGEVTHYDRLFLGAYSQVSVGLATKMVDARDGTVLWEAQHTARQHGWGIPASPIDAAMAVLRAAFNMKAVELLRTSDDLGRELVETIPGPTLAEALKPPQIQALLQDSGNQPKKAGDVIKVVMVGDPGNLATFHIGDFKRNIPMEEGPSGTYIGSYQVLPGDQVQGALVEGTLTNNQGNTATWVDPFGLVSIDTHPPEIPSGLRTLGRDATVILTWASNAGSDLAGYKVYRSSTPLSGYTPIRETEETTVEDTGLMNLTRYHYKVSAIDQAGNESPLSAAVMGIPIKPGPTVIQEDITVDTIWYAGASPYVLQEKVTVQSDVTLTIESGTIVESRDGSLWVKGRLQAEGKADALIVFSAAQGVTWEGITFDNTSERRNVLKYAKIKDARVGIHMISSSPEVTNTFITGNETGIRIEELSSPQLRENTITGNNGDGIMCINASPTVVANEISTNAGSGMSMEACRPVVSDNNIHANKGLQLQVTGQAVVNVDRNWWGSTEWEKIAPGISGPATISQVLDAPYPKGKEIFLEKLTAKQVEELAKRSSEAFRNGAIDEALVLYKKALFYRPDDPELHFQLGLIYYRQGKMEETVAALKKAVDLNPRHPGYYFNLGLVYSELGLSQEATAAWERTLELEPNHQSARSLLELHREKTKQ